MELKKIWRIRSTENKNEKELPGIENEFTSLENTLILSNTATTTIDQIQEVHLTLSKIINFYNLAKNKMTQHSSQKVIDKMIRVKDTIQTQTTIVRTLFKLAEQGCATNEEIHSTKKEGILFASKIEHEIMKILIEIRSKRPHQPVLSSTVIIHEN